MLPVLWSAEECDGWVTLRVMGRGWIRRLSMRAVVQQVASERQQSVLTRVWARRSDEFTLSAMSSRIGQTDLRSSNIKESSPADPSDDLVLAQYHRQAALRLRPASLRPSRASEYRGRRRSGPEGRTAPSCVEAATLRSAHFPELHADFHGLWLQCRVRPPRSDAFHASLPNSTIA